MMAQASGLPSSTHTAAVSTTRTVPSARVHRRTCAHHQAAQHLQQTTPHRPSSSTVQRRQLIVGRTSADWWEDEQEFDAVAGELILPKTIYVLSVPPPSEAIASAPTLEQEPQKQQEEAEGWLAEASAEILSGHVEGNRATGAFCAEEVASIAEGVWSTWGASGPPYFKRVKKRAVLDAMAQSLSKEEAEAFLKELFSQNWRVELDAGLGVNLNPREHLLIVCTWPASDLLLETMGFKKAAQSTGGVVVSKVEADGWNTSDMAAEDLKPLLSWRDLKPRMIGRRYTHPPVEMF